MSETKVYSGGCHCGAVRYEVSMAPPKRAMACNCSICKPMGWRLAFVPSESFSLKSGSDTLTNYQFGNKHIHHKFCSVCGIRSFFHGANPDGGETFSINLNCVQGMDAQALEVDWFDGAAL